MTQELNTDMNIVGNPNFQNGPKTGGQSPWWWCIVSLPTLALAPILVFFNKRKNKAGIACTTFLVDLYNSVLMTGWIGVVFLWCITLISENKISIIPMFLFAYSVATSPFLYLASKEPKDCYATNLSILVIVLGSFLTVVLFFIGLPLIYPISILCFLMLIKTIGVTIISVLISSEIEQSS